MASDAEDDYDGDDSIDDSLLTMNNEMQIRENHEALEQTESAMGPNWKKTYHILVELLKIFFPEPLIREILGFHAADPPVTHPVYKVEIKMNPDYRFLYSGRIDKPQCYNCCLTPPVGTQIYAAARSCTTGCYCNTIKIRIICEKCMPNSLTKFANNFSDILLLENEAKFGPGLIPKNDKADAALLSIDCYWRIGMVRVLMAADDGNTNSFVNVDMYQIMRAFNIEP